MTRMQLQKWNDKRRSLTKAKMRIQSYTQIWHDTAGAHLLAEKDAILKTGKLFTPPTGGPDHRVHFKSRGPLPTHR